MATAKVERHTDYRKGYPWVVFFEGQYGNWIIDSWHKTKREAMATARDIEDLDASKV